MMPRGLVRPDIDINGRPDGEPGAPQDLAGDTSSPAPPPPPRGTRARRWLRIAILALAVLVAAVLLRPWISSWFGPPPPAGLLFASGRIEGRITTLTPRSSAWVGALPADEGQAV